MPGAYAGPHPCRRLAKDSSSEPRLGVSKMLLRPSNIRPFPLGAATRRESIQMCTFPSSGSSLRLPAKFVHFNSSTMTRYIRLSSSHALHFCRALSSPLCRCFMLPCRLLPKPAKPQFTPCFAQVFARRIASTSCHIRWRADRHHRLNVDFTYVCTVHPASRQPRGDPGHRRQLLVVHSAN